VEDQATDRAHRIGQDQPVTVYRLIAKDTVEEGIVRLHGEKRELADALLEGTGSSASLSYEEMVALMTGGAFGSALVDEDADAEPGPAVEAHAAPAEAPAAASAVKVVSLAAARARREALARARPRRSRRFGPSLRRS